VAHQHYKGTGQTHSFRGRLVDDGQDKIRIEGATGEIAWRITKFSLLATAPSEITQASTVQIWREEQSTIVSTIDFRNNELLAAGIYHGGTGTAAPRSVFMDTIFDNQLFSRNIFVTHSDVHDDALINYYIELEEVKVSAAGMAQLAVAASRRT